MNYYSECNLNKKKHINILVLPQSQVKVTKFSLTVLIQILLTKSVYEFINNIDK